MVRAIAIFIILFAASARAEHSVPSRELQGHLRMHEVFETFNTLSGARFAGRLEELCDGGPISLDIRSLRLHPTSWFMPSSGRSGIKLDLALTAHLTFDGESSFCGIDGEVQCNASMDILGDLEPNSPQRGRCAVPGFEALTFGFKLIDGPKFIGKETSINLPACDDSGDEYSCIAWGEMDPKADSIYPIPERERRIRYVPRLYGYDTDVALPDVPRPPGPNKFVQYLRNLNFNVHIGTDHTLAETFEDPFAAERFLRLVPDRPDQGFALELDLRGLEPTYDPQGNRVDEGLFGQVFPIVFLGRDQLPIVGAVNYQIAVNSFRLYSRQRNGTHEDYVIELEALEPLIRSDRTGNQIELFDSLRVRINFKEISVEPDGKLRFQVSKSQVRLRGLFGLISIGFRTQLLNDAVEDLFKGMTIAELEEEFDIALPKCIVAEGNPSRQEEEQCSKGGLLKHVAGTRGARAKLIQNETTLKEGLLRVSGSLEVTPIGVEP